jgi:hypothetical protein
MVNPKWLRQQTPSKQQIRLWKGYIKSSFLRYVPYWKTAPIQVSPVGQPSAPPSPTTLDNFMEYLSSLPQSSRRMIDDIDQTSPDLQVWRLFHSQRRLFIATDGGLLKTQGTHGWVISNGLTVSFRCAGPVDGPFDTSSSTRCQLSGYASALLFIDYLLQFWGIRHKCRFTWICDSKAAIFRVRRFATRHPSRRMPPDIDLISILRMHLASIKCKVKHQWIKGHQDSSLTRILSVPAILNIEADSLASGCRTIGSLRSRPGCKHSHPQQFSISINHQRLTGQFDECIQCHVNGNHLRHYLQEKTSWSDNVWDTIDKHYCRLSSRQQITRTKFVRDQLPLGDRRFQQAPTKDPLLSLCPCCKVTVENINHLLRYTSCPQQVSHVKALKAAISTSNTHPERYVILADILHWLDHADSVPFTPSLSKYEPRFITLLQEAFQSQACIGWGNALKGFFSKSWREIASHDFHNPKRMDSTHGESRLRSIVDATHEFTRSIWLSRNSALHGKADVDARSTRDTEIAEIKHYHSMPHLLPLHNQHSCSNSLGKLISGPASTRCQWLQVAKRSMAAFERDGYRQTLLTSFFPRSNSS